jgi:hypothetical protein
VIPEAGSMQVPDGRVQVQRRHHPRTPHPLATRSGIELLGMLIAADQHWRPLSARQKTVLTEAYRTALAAVPDDVPDGTTVPLPVLPDGVHPATLRSLHRRGLATDGRLTPLGVEVCSYALLRQDRPVHTRATTGGLL